MTYLRHELMTAAPDHPRADVSSITRARRREFVRHRARRDQYSERARYGRRALTAQYLAQGSVP